MKQWLVNGVRFFLVTVGIIALTSFSIDATDTLRGSQTALSIFSKSLTAGSCPQDMVRIDAAERSYCLDVYEASPSPDCVFTEPKNSSDSAVNLADRDCYPVSEEERLPWVQVAQPQAAQLCAKVGKRLPTSEEWYEASLGSPDSQDSCNTAGEFSKTGAYSGCQSGVGVHDMVGNVWEFVDGLVLDGEFEGKQLPTEGYVAVVDERGLPSTTASEPELVYNNDYFWSEPEGQYALMRGGFYGSQDDGGVYAVHAKTAPTFASGAIGFRCAMSLSL
jgi:formylglycine-generating enzyme required for sulfatase activity